MRHLLKNKKNAQIMVNNSHYFIKKAEEKKKQYTARDVKITDYERLFQHTTSQPVKQILHAVDNNTLQDLPIFREYVRMAEEIEGPSLPHLQGKMVRHKVHPLDPVIVPKSPKGILDRYNNVTLC